MMSNSEVWELIHDLNRKDLQETLSLEEFIQYFSLKLEKMFNKNWDTFVNEQNGGEA
tara:strand:- start:728 stop:898 length:171 start_codon:yes stop_codon:yes gene_type:complete